MQYIDPLPTTKDLTSPYVETSRPVKDKNGFTTMRTVNIIWLPPHLVDHWRRLVARKGNRLYPLGARPGYVAE